MTHLDSYRQNLKQIKFLQEFNRNLTEAALMEAVVPLFQKYPAMVFFLVDATEYDDDDNRVIWIDETVIGTTESKADAQGLWDFTADDWRFQAISEIIETLYSFDASDLLALLGENTELVFSARELRRE